MAKSKEQKQQEAIARNTEYFDKHHLPNWRECQPGGKRYERILKDHGSAEAQKCASTAETILMTRAWELGLDHRAKQNKVV